MAQSGLPRGRSWTAGTAAGAAGGGSFSASSRWVRNERYRELKHLEQDAKRNLKEIKLLEIEIREQSGELEKLKKRDSSRASKISELSRTLESNKQQLQEKDRKEIEENGLGKDPKERSNAGEAELQELQEELTRLKHEHAGIQTTMEEKKTTLEQKRRELDRLVGQHQGMCDQITMEEKALQNAELEESVQQSVAVQHEMRSLSEDLGRLGRLMEGISPPPTSDQPMKQQIPITGRPQKPRVYHGVTNRGTKSVVSGSRNSHDGVVSGLDSHGRSTSFGRHKEPAEFEEREGGNRKRHKNSSFEQELERLHELKERLENEAQEKQMLLDSVARFSTQSRDGGESRKLSLGSQPMLSPSSVFEGFNDTPSVGPTGGGGPATAAVSTEESSSASSDISSEDITTVEKRDEEVGLNSSAAKRLSFGDDASSSRIGLNAMVVVPDGTGERHMSEETGEESNSTSEGDEIQKGKENFSSVDVEVGSEGSCSDINEEGVAVQEKGSKEACTADEGGGENNPQLESVGEVNGEKSARRAGSMVGEIDRLEKELGSWGDEETPEILPLPDGLSSGKGTDEQNHMEPAQNGPQRTRSNKMKRSLESTPSPKNEEFEEEVSEVTHVSSFPVVLSIAGKGENDDDVTTQTAQEGCEDDSSGTNIDQLKTTRTSKNEECGDEATEASSFPVVLSIVGREEGDHNLPLSSAPNGGRRESSVQNREGKPVRQASPPVDNVDKHRIWRQNVENQIKQLSLQLSLLYQKVEREVELQDDVRKREHLEQSSAVTEQLNKQVNCFGNEVAELRQSIIEMQQNLLKELETRTSAEHSVEQFRSICTDQSSKLEHLETRVSLLAQQLEEQLKLSNLEEKLDKEVQERLKVEAQLKDLSQAIALTVNTREKGEEAVEELVEQQKILLVDQLKEAEKLRTVAEVRVFTLDKQVEQLEMVCDVAQNIQEVLKIQDKALKFGLQTLIQLLMLALGVATLYSRVTEGIKGSLIPT